MISTQKSIILSLLFFTSINLILAQQERIDSLKQLLKSESRVQYQFKLSYEIAWDYLFINSDSAFWYAKRSNELAKSYENVSDLGASYTAIGHSNYVKGKYNDALVWYDSAYQEGKRTNHIENQLAAINNKGIIYNVTGQNAKAYTNYMQGIKIAEENNVLNMAGNMSGNLGSYFQNNGNYDSAIHYHQKAYDLFRQVGDAQNQSLMFVNIGSDYYYKADWPKAFLYSKKGMEEAEAIGFERVINLASTNIALIYEKIDSPEKAIEYLTPVLQSYVEAGIKESEALAAFNLSTFYEVLEDFDRALEYAEQSLEIYENNNSKQLSGTYVVLGRIHYKRGNKPLAYEFFNKAKVDAKKKNNNQSLTLANIFLGKDHIENKRYRNAIDILSENLRLSEEIDLPATWGETYELLAMAYRKTGEVSKAYDHLEKSNLFTAQIKDEERTNALARSAIAFETEKQEQELVQLKQEAVISQLQLKEKSYYNMMLSIATAVVVLLALVIYLFAKQKRRTLLHNNQLIKEKLLRVQLNPHFIFNALNAIQRYIYSTDTQSANQFLSKFARLMRQTLESSTTDFILLSEEIEMLEDYLSLQNLRKPFKYKITYDESLDPEALAIPPMFAQPFVENAIEHGIGKNSEQAEILIHFALDNDIVNLTIKDNGEGIDNVSEAKLKTHKSRATLITQERISVLGNNLKKKVAFEVQSLNEGTQVIFHLPFQQL
ncbi:tetratricopeptide repeat-containing sensor histidine kinase [Roseivirga misakiensis]|uniref:Signal transduction histidine kinase internal region domain-containing protein n=1 Tax=Roseivirga misakiensis TaxID=1563681 RepID=A0A1E5T8D1_9BACT|nr:tetratricopeptide repeat protein [Roseivirga misakiensis]OEK07642.1 hypothetical protein BFP71_00020 [Roseivirga misakiensis]